MQKKFILILLICFWQKVYPITTMNFTKQLVVIYKVLDPLKVVVQQPEKMFMKSGNQEFRYSEVATSKSPLSIKIEAPYNKRDEILDRIYGTATLELESNGNFDLIDKNNSNNIIKGRGFFSNDTSHLILPLYNASAPDKYQTSTTVDAIFNEDMREMKMGSYKGVLKLNVTYGG